MSQINLSMALLEHECIHCFLAQSWLLLLQIPHLDGRGCLVHQDVVCASPPRLALVPNTPAGTIINAPPCKRWIGWCDEHTDNVAHSGDNQSQKSTGPCSDLQVDLHSLTKRMLAIENGGRVMILVICVLQLFLFLRM